ncbi:NUDIX hydrolase [Actinomadura chibensis]|uniref:NUDIX hydrolase n=1 Tax=Actinomadura chibensis TaxID=392828 RepID=A0A5D0NX01_9ACTN|nr:NUDIX hydrolase [Actinomadura chibensis]TYB49007.1 NUDIX hydrolase [Actinomadura chibensis]
MRWKVHSEESIFSDPWLEVRLADVEITRGRRLQHRVIRSRGASAGAVVVDAERRVLLEWRHRFITDAWGYEIPIGGVEEGETPAEAAAREVEEETGWRPGAMRPFTVVHPTPGISDSRHHIFWADGATRIGAPADDWESERVEWVPLAEIRGLVEAGKIVSGTSMAALLLAAR